MITSPAPTFAGELLRTGGQVALIDGDTMFRRDELIDAVSARRRDVELPARSLVVLSGDNSFDFVVTYLALLEGGHVPLLAGKHAERLAEAWGAASIRSDRTALGVSDRHLVDHQLHPDLALLLNTSGSTGSAKLVRLSHGNLSSNARAIVEYLGLTDCDRAITSLPLHYCYGLSVLHSHLLTGAGVVLTDASVVDPCFEAAIHTHGVTSLAGVPHTFEMLERAGAARIAAPSLRFMTQAGGRMSSDAVTRWSRRAQSWGADFYVMYGQTEATARIAYLPPELARCRPEAIGVAIPGVELRLDRVEDRSDDVGELVVRGPNVMMGYAERSADLALGPQLSELHTGDLARFHPDDGVFEIVGRRSRFVKPFGLRVDLDVVERALQSSTPGDVAVTGDDDRIVIVAPGADVHALATTTAALTGLPSGSITVLDHTEVPRTESNKVDTAAILALGASAGEPLLPRDHGAGRLGSLTSVYARVLGVDRVRLEDSFVSLGGDSLSYVECSIQLETILGRLPTDWHLRSIRELAEIGGPRRRTSRIDTTVVLRAVGICLVVATHMRVWFWPGGAHLLLAVAGFNLARFMMPIESTRDRVMSGLRTVARVAVPTVLWVAAGMVLFGAYSVGTLLLVNNYLGAPTHRDDHWAFWFIEVFVHLVLITTALLAIPAVHRLERRFPYLFALALLLIVLNLRWEVFQLGDFYNMRFRTHGVAWFFVLGWLVCRSTTSRQRVLTTMLCLATAPGFFGYAPREWFIASALILLVWCRELPFPRLVARPVGVVAAASMWIFITHFTVWPQFTDGTNEYVAYAWTIAAGVLVWFAVDRATRLVVDRARRHRPQGSAPLTHLTPNG